MVASSGATPPQASCSTTTPRAPTVGASARTSPAQHVASARLSTMMRSARLMHPYGSRRRLVMARGAPYRRPASRSRAPRRHQCALHRWHLSLRQTMRAKTRAHTPTLQMDRRTFPPVFLMASAMMAGQVRSSRTALSVKTARIAVGVSPHHRHRRRCRQRRHFHPLHRPHRPQPHHIYPRRQVRLIRPPPPGYSTR